MEPMWTTWLGGVLSEAHGPTSVLGLQVVYPEVGGLEDVAVYINELHDSFSLQIGFRGRSHKATAYRTWGITSFA